MSIQKDILFLKGEAEKFDQILNGFGNNKHISNSRVRKWGKIFIKYYSELFINKYIKESEIIIEYKHFQKLFYYNNKILSDLLPELLRIFRVIYPKMKKYKEE